MIPEVQPAPAHRLVKNAGHAHRQRGGAARSAEQCLFPDGLRQVIHLLDRDRKAHGRHLCGGLGRRAFDVHAEVHSGFEGAGRNQGHNGHQRLQTHRPVTDRSGIAFPGDDFRRRAAGNQGVESGDSATGNRYKTEWKQLARKYRTGAVDEPADGREFQRGQNQKNPQRQGEDGAQLHERAQVIARRQQQPDREHTRGKPIEHDGPGERFSLQREQFCQAGVAVDELSAPNRQQQQRDAQGGGLQDFAHTPPAEVAAHEHRDGNRRAYRKNAPRTFGQRFDHHQGQHGQQDDHDRENSDDADDARRRVEFLFDHLRE